MSEQAVKEWPEIELWRDPLRPDLGPRFGLDFESPTEGFPELMRYIPQQRVNALVGALVDRLRDEARHAEQRSSAHRSHDEHMGAEEASGRAAAFSVSADLLAALANYKEGEA